MNLSSHQKMLLGIAIGDAYGAGYEFRYPDLKDYQNIPLDKYIKSAFPNSDHIRGMYTDDTQMSIAVTELLLSDKGFNKENLADKFVECYKRNPIQGYAKGFQAFLDSINSGKEFIEKIRHNSIRNGAAMRAAPLGVVEDLDTLIEYAKINARLTHSTPKGIASSVAVALMSHISLYEGFAYTDKDVVRSRIVPQMMKIDMETAKYIDDVLKMGDLDPVLLFGEAHSTMGVPCDGMRTVGAMIHLLTNFYGPREILEESVRLGGDVDSVASISLGIGLTNDDIGSLPSFLFDDLTNHAYGRDYLLSLGNSLEKKFPIY